MRRGLDGRTAAPDVPLAKTVKQTRHGRAYFRHELASALAFLAHEHWSRDADLAAYLIAAHHGKVRMNLRALPREAAPKDPDRAGSRFARGVWEGDELPPFALEGDERWQGGGLSLSIMELGWDEVSRESWTERTRELLARLGPFRLAWLETLLRVGRLARVREGARRRPEMRGEPLALPGCAPTPLASYLKALGVLRLVSAPANYVSGEAADPHARGWWENERFHLRTTLSRDALLPLLSARLRAEPDHRAVEWWQRLLRGGQQGRFRAARREPSSRALHAHLRGYPQGGPHSRRSGSGQAARRIGPRSSWWRPSGPTLPTKRSSGSTPSWLCRGAALPTRNCWERAATTDGSTSPTTSPRRLVSRAKPPGLFDASSGEPSDDAARLLADSLFSSPVLGLCSAAIGQFAPGAAGGPNATNGYSADSEVNPWDFVIMLEGAAAFAGAATRRHQSNSGSNASGSTTRSGASFPFTVRPVGAGWGGVGVADENDARAEFWAPIWTRPARALEIDSLFGEGRAVLNERTAKDGLEFARAAASLGVSRGFREFERYGFLMRAGRTYLATPIGRRSAAASLGAELVADLDVRGWLDRVRRVGRSGEEPGAARRAIKHLEDALFGLLAAAESPREAERTIVALGRVVGWLGLSPERPEGDRRTAARIVFDLAPTGRRRQRGVPRRRRARRNRVAGFGTSRAASEHAGAGSRTTRRTRQGQRIVDGTRDTNHRTGDRRSSGPRKNTPERRATNGGASRSARRTDLLLRRKPRHAPGVGRRRRAADPGVGRRPARPEPHRRARTPTRGGVHAWAGRQAVGRRDGGAPRRCGRVPRRRLRRCALRRAARGSGVGAAGATSLHLWATGIGPRFRSPTRR